MRNKLSWTLILLIAVVLPAARVAFDFKRLLSVGAPPTTGPASPQAQAIDLPTVMAGKYLVGTSLMLPSSKGKLQKQLDVAGKTPMQRVAFATISGELGGKSAALERLDAIPDEPDARAFERLYSHQTPLPTAIVERYGFFAKLAASNGLPNSVPLRKEVFRSAERAFVTVVGLGIAIAVGGSIGFCLFVTAIVLLVIGKIRFAVQPPTDQASSAYVQSFAWYLSLMLGVSLLLAVVLARFKTSFALPHGIEYSPLILAVAIGFTWPLIRGVPWKQMRFDLGIHGGRSVFVEPLCGIAGYLAGVPIIALGMITTLLLSKISGSDVSHPVVKELFSHPIEILVLACVFAPITEETLFRGAFVSHLRSFANPWLAALISGVIFAAIHPQGWAAIPALGSIGFVLAMIRQWRGSLIASITAHALNNAGAMALVLLMG